MIGTKQIRSFTLLAKCSCGYTVLIRCANRGVAVKELEKLHSCPKCFSNDLLYIVKRGQYKSEEFLEAVKREI